MKKIALGLSLTTAILASGCGGGGGYAGLSPEKAREMADVAAARVPNFRFVFDHLQKGQDPLTRDAWIAFYNDPQAFVSLCKIYVRKSGTELGSGC